MSEITISGNLTTDPELHYTTSGQAVLNIRIADTPRYKDQATGEWRNGTTVFTPIVAWRDLGAHAAEALAKGDRVIVTGRMRSRDYTDDGTSTAAPARYWPAPCTSWSPTTSPAASSSAAVASPGPAPSPSPATRPSAAPATPSRADHPGSPRPGRQRHRPVERPGPAARGRAR